MPELNPETLKAMKEAAAKATPGPWRAVALLADCENHHVLAGKFSDRHIKATADDGNGLIAFADLPANTEFIGTCNPASVSALIADHERLKDENEQLKEQWNTRFNTLCGLCGKRYLGPRDEDKHGYGRCDLAYQQMKVRGER